MVARVVGGGSLGNDDDDEGQLLVDEKSSEVVQRGRGGSVKRVGFNNFNVNEGGETRVD